MLYTLILVTLLTIYIPSTIGHSEESDESHCNEKDESVEGYFENRVEDCFEIEEETSDEDIEACIRENGVVTNDNCIRAEYVDKLIGLFTYESKNKEYQLKNEFNKCACNNPMSLLEKFSCIRESFISICNYQNPEDHH
ncbi:hypothetical protein CHUAL_011559 [Chamberlinius hualienensis]